MFLSVKLKVIRSFTRHHWDGYLIVSKHIYKFLLLSFFILASECALAEDADMPDFESAPTLYAKANWITNSSSQKMWVVDQMLWGNQKNEKKAFWLFLYGPNYHQCSLSGEVVKITESNFQFKEQECTLVFNFTLKGVSISDQNNACKANHCGNNAYFDKAKLFKVHE